MDITHREVSYIRARDPSIQNFNRFNLKKARKNINECISNSSYSDEIQEIIEEEEDKHIQVYLRVKQSQNEESSHYTIQGNELICRIPDQTKSTTYNKYIFNRIFGPNSKQIEIFDFVVKPKILEFINGKDSSLFTYGASGAGKTFTIIGTMEEPGLIPRALEYLFRSLPTLPKVSSVKPSPDGNVSRLNGKQQSEEFKIRESILKSQKSIHRAQNIKTYNGMQARLSNDPVAELETIAKISLGVWVSLAEIYNEEIYDLLHSAPPRGKQKLRVGTSNNHAYVKDLTYVNVSDGLQAYQVFQYGIQKIKYAETNLNNHSSRSHSIFSVRIAQALDEGVGAHVSTFNFCDLAGVERSKKTLNVGERLKESNSINRSLMVFGKCISALRNSQKCNKEGRIPFRESKLTQLFQRPLSGLEEMCMIVNLNTSKNMAEESYNVLNFSVMTKQILAPITEAKKLDLESQERLDEEIEKVETLLLEAKQKYKKMVEERKRNLEIEERETIEGYQELEREIVEVHKKRMKNLRENDEIDLEILKSMMLTRHLEKIENAKRRKKSEQKNSKTLREKSKEQQKCIKELQDNIKRLNVEIEDVTKIVNARRSNDESFLRHENECEREEGGTIGGNSSLLNLNKKDEEAEESEIVCSHKGIGILKRGISKEWHDGGDILVGDESRVNLDMESCPKEMAYLSQSNNEN